MNMLDFVGEAEVLSDVDDDMNIFHIALGVDADYIPPLGVMLTSLALNNMNINIMVHIFADSINHQDKEKLRILGTLYKKMAIRLYKVNPEIFAGFTVYKGYSIATFHRILIMEVLQKKIDKVLYIDADTLCVGEIKGLAQLDVASHTLFAKTDSGEWLKSHKQYLKFSENRIYFNAGVLYVNLRAWHKASLSERMIEMLNEYPLPMQDQDALNLLLESGYGELPEEYNHFCLLKHEEKNEREDNTVFIHYAGQVKPWHPWCRLGKNTLWLKYKEQSLWDDYVYYPRNYQENRLLGRVKREQGEWMEAFRWYGKYALDKFRERML